LAGLKSILGMSIGVVRGCQMAKFNVIMTDLKNFLVYFFTEPLKQLWLELVDIWCVVTEKRAWIYTWFVMFLVFAFIKNQPMMIFSLIMFLAFFVVYQWQKPDWRGQARERWFKKQGLERYKKPKKKKKR